MKCDLPIELLSGYIDGELDKEQKAEVEKHLKKCKHCRVMLKELKTIDEFIRKQKFEEPSREFVFTLNRRIMEKVKKKRRFFIFRYTPVFVPAAVAVLILIVLTNIAQQSRLISIGDRIIYAEITKDAELELDIPKTKSAFKAESGEKIMAKGIATDEAIAPRVELAKKSKIAEERELHFGELDDKETQTIDLSIPKDRVTRAIIDSDGMVIKVATGNTIQPERDTFLENRLQGQQLTPPTIEGKQVQMYVDLTPTKE